VPSILFLKFPDLAKNKISCKHMHISTLDMHKLNCPFYEFPESMQQYKCEHQITYHFEISFTNKIDYYYYYNMIDLTWFIIKLLLPG